jgi:hypothetical protein
LNAEIFFDMLFYAVSQNEHASLSYMVSLLQSDFGINIKKQSLNERFNPKSEAFAKAVLCEALREKFSHLYSTQFLPAFSRIRIKDSTKFMVPPSLESRYTACGGDIRSRSKAGISIQYEYDLKSGNIMDLDITAGERNDRTDALQTSDNIQSDDLILRDLGYFSTVVFRSYAENGAFFLSRLDSSTNVYDVCGEQISFKEIYKSMQKNQQTQKEIFVLVGKQSKLPVRLIMQTVPQEVYEQRIRKKTTKSKGQGRGKLTLETKLRCRFNLFITNTKESQLSINQVLALYKLRWQIELQFKIWKSVFKIDSFRQVKEQRYMTVLYIKLLLIVINLQITYCLQRAVEQPCADKINSISLNKALKTLKTLFVDILSILRATWQKAKKTIQYIQNRLNENHWLECKKNKIASTEIIKYLYINEIELLT